MRPPARGALGAGVPTAFPVGGLPLSSGQTYGLYITLMQVYSGINYTDGTTAYSNADITVYHGMGRGQFQSDFQMFTFYPRVWDGTIYYDLGGPNPDVPEPFTMLLGAIGIGTLGGLRRLRKS